MTAPAFLWTLRALASHWARRPFQLAALLAGLAAATALWSGVQALNLQAKASYARAAEAFSGGGLDALVAAQGGPMAETAFAALRQSGWPVSPVVEGRVSVAGDRLRLIGIEPVTLPPAAGLALFGPSTGPAAGPPVPYADFVLPPGRTLIAPETLTALGLSPGDRPETPRGPLPPLTPAPDVAPDVLVTDVGHAQPLLGLDGRLSRLMLAEPAPPGAPEGFRRQPSAPAADLGQLTDSFHLNLTAFGFLAFAVGLFIVHGAVGLAFEQRKPLIRTLRACGASAGGVAAALAAELALLALAAGAVGVALGYLIAGALLPDVAASLRGLYGARVPGTLSLEPWWWAAGLGIALLGAFAAGGAALWRAARLPVLETARPEAWNAAETRRHRWQLAGAGALAALALTLALTADGLLAGFALLGALLAAAALALPPLLGRARAAGAAAARTPLTLWTFADGRQNLSGLSLALMALLLALAVNIGVGTMVGGFRLTFADWLEDRLAAEIYVGAPTPGAAEALAAWLRARPEVSAVLPELRAEAALDGWPTEVQGFPDHTTFRDRWPLLAAAPGVWDRVAAGQGALVSEQLARRLGVGLGDPVTLPAPTGPWTLPVAGIHADYGNPLGQVRLGIEAMAERWPDAPRDRFAVRVAPGGTDAVMAALTGAGGPEITQAIDQQALKRLSLAVFERTFAVTAALNALTFGVAGLALLTSLATLSSARIPQLAPLWAMGVRRRTLAGLELGRTLALAAVVAALAIPLGLALAWVLTAVVNVAAFGWRLPLHVFPWQWLQLGALAVAVSGLACAGPLWRLARMPPAQLVKVFADDR